MSLTRRRLFTIAARDHSLTSEWIAARGREAAVAEGSLEFGQRAASSGTNSNVIRIASNENPLGPGQHVLDAIVGKFPEANRYPFNAQQKEPVLVDAIAKKFGVTADNVVLGAGSGAGVCGPASTAGLTATPAAASARPPSVRRP